MAGVRAKITGIGSAVPSRVMTNKDLEKIIDTTDEWIVQRTGIRERHVCSQGECTSVLAAKAAAGALESAGIKATDLDLIIVATCTPDMPLPSCASLVQKAIGATEVPCFDLAAACSGFVYGLTVGSQFIETGKYKKILVIGADTLTTMTDYQDRGSCIIFGDGAGAVILEPTAGSEGVLYTVIKADGEGWDFIHTPAGGSKLPASHETVDAREHFIKMKGREVYKFAVEKMQWLLGDCMEKTGLTTETVDLVVPHQVNIRIIESATEKYNFPLDKVFVNIDRRGNTSAASIPLALDEANRQQNLIGSGKTIVMVAFGAGLTWAGAVVKF